MIAGATPADKAPDRPSAPPTAPLRRRLLSMTYEAMLLFAVVFLAGYLFDTLTQSRHALMFRHARQAWLFVILGAYFVWFWVHGGQTLAMKTWRVRVVERDGCALTYPRAIARYLLLWIFVLPTLALVWFLGLEGWAAVAGLAAALLASPLFARIDRDGQFIHDRVLGTRTVVA
jgi:uncharacterized RDD family membrane protein YckC